jgi:AraC family transcriptional regulator of adaptative response / DNA-3-methyladenine glycosylase II
VSVALAYTPPFAWDALLGFVAARAVPGVEDVDRARGTWRRGALTVRDNPETASLVVDGRASKRDVAALRALFDLDAEPAAIAAHLAHDDMLAPLVRARPGVRIPGAWDGFELALRAVLGQQVSVAAASTLATRLVARYDGRFPRPDELARVRPGPLARAIGVPGSRAATLIALARAVARGDLALEHGAPPEATIAALVELPGIGPWTAHYLALRALGWRDAFPSGDLVLLRRMGATTPKRAEARAEPWRPYRAYAALHLWLSIPVTVTRPRRSNPA